MLHYFLAGGWIMVPLFCLSVLGLAVIIDRLQTFRIAEQADSSSLFHKLTDNIDADNIDGALAVCREAKGPLAAVFYVGLYKYRVLRRLKRSRKEIEENLDKTISEYTPHVVDILEKRLNLLLMVASVSPLMGMTGTVTGMIRAFSKMAEIGGLEGGAVAGGISEALITTATGLIIAIPSLVFYNIFCKKVDNFTLEIEEKASDMVEYIHLYHGKLNQE